MTMQLMIVVTSGLFAAGTLAAASRIPTWLTMDPLVFKRDFARTIAIADKVQPALAVLTLVAIAVVVVGSNNADERYMIGAGLMLIAIVLASVAILVPLQRRIIDGTEGDNLTEALRTRWLRGHVARTAAALVAFGLTVAASVS